MSLLELACNQRWAMRADELRGLLDILARENLDPDLARQIREDRAGRPSALAARGGGKLDNTRGVQMRDGVAILDVVGPIVRRADMFSEISGASSVATIAADFTTALNAPNVDAILLMIDSPGGEVTGINEFAQMVMAARSTKPVWAYVEGLGASAAYWIASAAEQVVIDDTAALGSIGVVMAVRDPANEKNRPIEFVSSQSPHKRPDPTTESGRGQLQTIVDDTAAVFVAAVAAQRDVPEATVLSDFGAGGVLIGRAAVTAGLADRIGSFESTLADIQAAATKRKRPMYMAALTGETSMSNGKGFWADFWGGAREAGVLTDTPDTAPESVLRQAAQQDDPRVAELQRQLAEAQSREHERNAATFADTLIAQSKALPSERAALVAAYTTAAQADTGSAALGMVAALQAACDARPAHSLTKELIPAGPVGALPTTQPTDTQAQADQGRKQAQAYLDQLPKR